MVPRLSFSSPLLSPWCSNPINYCAPWRTMNVPISICLFISVSLYYFTNLFSSLSGKWPNLVLIYFFLSSVSLSSLSPPILKKKIAIIVTGIAVSRQCIEECHVGSWLWKCFITCFIFSLINMLLVFKAVKWYTLFLKLCQISKTLKWKNAVCDISIMLIRLLRFYTSLLVVSVENEYFLALISRSNKGWHNLPSQLHTHLKSVSLWRTEPAKIRKINI